MAGNFNLESVVQSTVEEAFRERGHVNILISGRTGVGKSTLVNSIFQGKMAMTGQGRPVTMNTREIRKEGLPLSIFDTRGLEMEDYQSTIKAVLQLVDARSGEIDALRHIHVAWVCIVEDLRRIEAAEEELVKSLAKHIPVVGVITKSRSDQGFRKTVLNHLPDLRNVVRVRAIQEELDEGIVLPQMGLKELVEVTMQLVPEGSKRAFIAAQKADIDLKVKRSHRIVAVAATTAAGLAAVTPIPLTESAAILPSQIAMIAGITSTFGMSVGEGFIASIITTISSLSGGEFIGLSLIKFIPGLGTAVGAGITATAAAGITTVLGEAYIAVLRLKFSQNSGEPPDQNKVIEALKEKLSEQMDKNS